jgi:hypothetical protein
MLFVAMRRVCAGNLSASIRVHRRLKFAFPKTFSPAFIHSRRRNTLTRQVGAAGGIAKIESPSSGSMDFVSGLIMILDLKKPWVEHPIACHGFSFNVKSCADSFEWICFQTVHHYTSG